MAPSIARVATTCEPCWARAATARCRSSAPSGKRGSTSTIASRGTVRVSQPLWPTRRRPCERTRPPRGVVPPPAASHSTRVRGGGFALTEDEAHELSGLSAAARDHPTIATAAVLAALAVASAALHAFLVRWVHGPFVF